jgi:DNA-binding beta-propeller fold protein YncE
MADTTDTPVILGSGEFRYRVQEGWGQLPEGWTFKEVGAVGVDRNDNVYVFNRGEHPMIVFDRDGNFLRSWGEDLFLRAHGVHMAPDDTIFCTDDGNHTVRKCTLDGKVLLELGVRDKPAPFMSGQPFCRCTHTALSPKGEIYVSDGYGNAQVHKYTPAGKLMFSWGKCGIGPGEFNLPHNIHCDAEGWVYVADRENHRVQVFDGDGKFETQWHNIHRPSALHMTAGPCPLCFIGEVGPYLNSNLGFPNLGPRISILDHTGKVLARLGFEKDAHGQKPGQFMSPHGITVDSKGDIYVGEVSFASWPSLYPGVPRPDNLRSLQKLIRLPPET